MNALTKSILFPVVALSAFSSLSAADFYPQPQPSNEEQYLLERINVARANPAAEGQMLSTTTDSEVSRYYSYYGVNRDQLRSDFASYAAKPPLAFNSDLMASSREHSLDMASRGFQSHDSTDGTHFDGRITNAGYQWHALGENVFSYVENPFFGHVGLNADWGVPSLDHRANIMNNDASFPTFKEIGISYVSTSVANFGPYVMTEDFGTPADDSASFLVGVVYNDADHNGSYDVGEGLGGVTITTDSGAYYTTTGGAGGYVIPLPVGSGTLTITATGGSLGAPRTKTITYGNANNVKADFTTNDAAAPAGPALPVVQIKASLVKLTPGGEPGVLTVARSGNKHADLQVALAFGGSAVPGVDCSELPSVVTIPAGAKSIQIPLAASTTADGTKKIKIKLQQSDTYLVSKDAKKARTSVKIWTPMQ